MIRKILHLPNPQLRKKSLAVAISEVKAGKYKRLICDLIETMIASDGIGLASPQVGKLIRIVIINTKSGPLALINPVISARSWRKCFDEEGCLSVPGTYGDVKRNTSLKVKAISADGARIEFRARGLFARVIDHEVDHLNGVLFIDKAKKIHEITKR